MSLLGLTAADSKTIRSIEFIDRYEARKPSLGDAIQDQPPPPCDTCKNFALCASQELACRAFYGYTHQPVSKGTYFDWERMDRQPTAKIFAKVFKRTEQNVSSL